MRIMKKVFVTLFLGVALLFSGNLYAGDKTFNIKIEPGSPSPTPIPHKPGMPAFHPVMASIDAETGELYLQFNRSMSSVEITISQNNTVYEDDIMNVVSGQTVIYEMGDYDTGEYTLSVEVDGDTIAQYTIVIEDEE